MMERSEIMELMGELRLYGMRLAFDEVMSTGLKRQHPPPQIVGDLLKAEIAEKLARSIKYQMTIAKLPLAKDIADFDFAGTPINEALVRDLVGGGFLATQRNVVLIAAPAPARPISPLLSPAAASETAPAAASSMSSIWSTGLRSKPGPGVRAAWPMLSPVSTSSFSMSWAICPSRKRAGNCSFI
jgi:hypothetical protein